MMHVDPMSINARWDFSYFINLLIKFKHKTLDRFKRFRLEIEKQLSKGVLTLRSNRGRQYFKGEF